MAAVAPTTGNIIRETVQEFSTDECTTMAASLAYYTIFSLPGLLVIVITVAGLFTGQKAAQSRI
jgi:membrane protein